MFANSVEFDSFLHDIALVHYSDELLDVFQKPLQLSLQGTSLYVINKTVYDHVVCCTLPLITKAKASPRAVQLLLTSTAQNSHVLMETINTIASKLGIMVKELLEPLPGSSPEILTTKPAIIIGSIKAFLAQKRVQSEFLQDVETITLDNVDAMLNLGYGEDIKTLLKIERIAQWLLFSSTENPKNDAIFSATIKNIQKIILEDTAISPDVLKQQLYHVNKQEKISLLFDILQTLPKAVVVCNTKGTAEYVTNKLTANSITASLFLSFISRKEQKEILERFTNGTISVLVTNDKSLERSGIKTQYIISYDLPLSPQAYKLRLHHIDTSSTHLAISFACEEYVYNLPIIEQELGFKLPVQDVVPSQLKVDKAVRSNEQRRSRTHNKSNYSRSSGNDAHTRTTGKQLDTKHASQKCHADNNKKPNHANKQGAYSNSHHRKNLDASLYAMSAEERLKFYQEKYSKKFNKSIEQSNSKAKRQHANDRPNARATNSMKKQVKKAATERSQTESCRKLNRVTEQAKSDDTRKQKPSVLRALLAGISNFFKPKIKKEKQH